MIVILGAGGLSEAQLLGGTAVVMIAQDIQNAFGIASNWPNGSVQSMFQILGPLSVPALKRIGVNGIVGRQ